jgi:hypothetical protein
MEAVLGTSALVASAVVLAATGTLGVFVVAAVTLPLVGSISAVCYGLFRDVKYGIHGQHVVGG